MNHGCSNVAAYLYSVLASRSISSNRCLGASSSGTSVRGVATRTESIRGVSRNPNRNYDGIRKLGQEVEKDNTDRQKRTNEICYSE